MAVKKVLFLCTYNSARSQMAEGLLNHLGKGRFQAFSAGTVGTTVNTAAIDVLNEIGIDISSHQSKTIDEFTGREFDYVVTLCDRARDACPYFPGKTTILHQYFPDPALTEGTTEEIKNAFRSVRDQIYSWIGKTFLTSENK